MEKHGRRSLIWTGVAICMISWCILGIMGDVPDGFVYTDLLQTIPRGSTAVLKCEFYGPPLAVYWKKGEDPKQAPTLIAWMDEQIWPGVCAEDNSCEMGDGYSLIIRDAQIEDQDRYICRVLNHLGILIHNFTDLTIFEPPREPYPVIKECNDSSSLQKDYGCDIHTMKNVNLTCSASSFFPDLDLFFLHGTEKSASTWTHEWTNNDGTRSKSVSINAAPKETPYVCVASDVPGNQKERAMTVFVRLLHLDTSTASTWSTPLPSKELNVVIIIVVPVVFLTTALVSILIVCWRRQRRQVRKRRGQEKDLPLLDQMTITARTKPVTLNPVETYSYSLKRPYDVIMHAGRYVVTDTHNGRIVAVSATNQHSVLYKAKSPYLPFRPYSIVALSDTEDSFLITDRHRNKKKGNVFKLKNDKLTPFSSTYDFQTPTGITLNNKRDRVYIAETDSACILEFDIDGTYIGKRGKNSLITPWFIACDSQDQIYVTEQNGIKVFDQNWTYVTTVSIDILGKTWCYRGIAIDKFDNIFITARSRDSRRLITKETVAAISARHNLVKEYTGGILYHKHLRGICIDFERNKVVVVNGEKHKIDTYTLY